MAITVEEWQLLSFFEAMPDLSDDEKDAPWCYNTATYTTWSNRFQVCCSISPAYPDFTLTVRDAGEIVFEVSALGIQDIRYSKDNAVEVLEVRISDKHRILLTLRPALKIEEKIGFIS